MVIDNDIIKLSYGVHILSFTGENDVPKVKRPYRQDWPDTPGIDVDLTTYAIGERPITCKFLLMASSDANYQTQLDGFTAMLTAPGLRVCKFTGPARPYFLYVENEIKVNRLTPYGSSQMAAELSVHFVEKYPVARYYATGNPAGTVSFTITCTEAITILFSDGYSQIVKGTNVAVSRALSAGYVWYVAMAGDKTKITSITNIVGLTLIQA